MDPVYQPFYDHIDIEGNPVPPNNFEVDLKGNCYDKSKFDKKNGSWYYNGRLLVLDTDGQSALGFAEFVNPQFNEEDRRSSASRSNGSDTDALSTPTSPSVQHLDLTTPKQEPILNTANGRSLELANIDIDRVPTESVRIPHVRYTNFDADPTEVFSIISQYVRETALIAPNDRKRPFGFIAEDLLNNNILSCQPCRASNLEQPTLKIFRLENFLDVPQDVYDTMLPALALAEKFVLQGSPSFFVSLVCGTRVVDEQLTGSGPALVQRLYPVPSVTHHNFAQLLTFLENLSTHIEWRFEDMPGLFGVHPVPRLPSIPNNISIGGWRYGDPTRRPVLVRLNKDFYDCASVYARIRNPDEAAKLRFLFFLAVVVTHELCHAIESTCADIWYLNYCAKRRAELGRAISFPIRCNESLWEDSILAEMGALFEYQTFGGIIVPINNRVHAKHGLAMWNGGPFGGSSNTFLSQLASGNANGVAIPMGYIEELQQSSFWSRDISRRPNIKIPTEGLTSASEPWVTTVSWRQHLLDQEELRHRDVGDHGDSEDEEPDSKRLRIEKPPSQKPTPPSRIPRPQNRRLQIPIRKYTSKAFLDEQAMRAEMIRNAEQEQREADLQKAAERLAAESRRMYVSPPSNQHELHDFLRYEDEPDSPNSDNSEEAHNITRSSYDPLKIPPEKLRVSDKWILCQDYASLTLGWDTATFLAARDLNDIKPISSRYNPNFPNSWSQTELHHLTELRRIDPSRSFPVLQAAKRAEKTARYKLAKTLAEMEELATLMGYSRIQFQKLYHAGSPLPLGMTVENFDTNFRGLLNAQRLTIRITSASTEHQTAVATGEVLSPVKTAADTRTSDWIQTLIDHPRTPPSPSAPVSGSQSNKITNYTVPVDQIT